MKMIDILDQDLISEAKLRDYVKKGLRGAAIGGAMALGLSGTTVDKAKQRTVSKNGLTTVYKQQSADASKKRKVAHDNKNQINISNTKIGDGDE